MDLSSEQIRLRSNKNTESNSKRASNAHTNTTANFKQKQSPRVKLSNSGGFNADATTNEEQEESKTGGTPGFGTKMMFKPDRTL